MESGSIKSWNNLSTKSTESISGALSQCTARELCCGAGKLKNKNKKRHITSYKLAVWRVNLVRKPHRTVTAAIYARCCMTKATPRCLMAKNASPKWTNLCVKRLKWRGASPESRIHVVPIPAAPLVDVTAVDPPEKQITGLKRGRMEKTWVTYSCKRDHWSRGASLSSGHGALR